MRISLVWWLAPALLLSACSMELQHDLNEEDANEIYVLLQHHNLDPTKTKEGDGKDVKYTISVPKAKIASAAQLLRDNSLPRPMAAGLSVFKQTKGMIPTQTEERAMFMEALEGDASNALNRIPGVLEARVLVMIPEVSDLSQPELKPKPSASVLIKYIPGEGKPPVTPADVQEFVARAVPELIKENVKVLMIEAKSSASTDTEGEQMIDDHLGVRLESASVPMFRLLIALPTLLFLSVSAVLAFVMLRKPAAKPNGNGLRRTKTTPPEG